MSTPKERTNFQVAIETRLLYDLLSTAKVGEIITYAKMSELLGYPVSGNDYHLQGARRMLLNNDRRVFGAVYKVGCKRLSDAEIVATGEQDRARIRRAARRAMKRITSVENFDALPNDVKIKHNTYLSVFGAVAGVLKPSRVAKIEHEVERTQVSLPLAKTLEAFKKTEG